MKRGLKVALPCPSIAQVVATYAPMKRGLKGNAATGSALLEFVATYAPMKRGLKVN